jgi:hypothetical protein
LDTNSRTAVDEKFIRVYKFVSFVLIISFALVGLIFLFFTNNVIIFFNNISLKIGFIQSPKETSEFYSALAVAYMYLVTLLAIMMFRQPKNKYFLLLLINGKMASSVISILYFLTYNPYLILLSNFIIDGTIAILLLFFYLKLRRSF